MSRFPQALPTTDTDAGTVARRLLTLKGPAFQAPDGTLNAADALTMGAAMAVSRTMLLTQWAQAFVSDATYMLGELERFYALPTRTGSTNAERQSRLLAFVRASSDGTPASIEAAVASLAGSCTVVETTARAVYAVDPSPTEATRRNVFRFAVVVPFSWAKSATTRAQIAAVVNRMKPAHTAFEVTNASGFLCDSATSLTDVTCLDG